MHLTRKFLIVIFLSLIVYSANTGGVSIYFLDEAKNSGCAMEMYQNNEWITPTFNNELRTDKPVLHYYFMKAGYALFGVGPMGARFFSSIMGMLMVMTVFLFVRKIVNEHAAFMTALILISSIQLAVQFHLAVPDPYLLFFLTAGWLSFYYGWRYESKPFLYLFYVAISLAFLTKGPVAIVFSGLIVVLFLISQRALRFYILIRLALIEGILIFCAIGLPWYILVGIETNGEWIDHFFFKHNVGRFTQTMEGHGGFPLASFVVLLGGLMPFSFFIPQTMRMVWKDRAGDTFLVFCACVASVVVLFFAFSRTMLPTYPEPAFSFVAILLGVYLSKEADRSKGRMISSIVYLIISLAMPVAAYMVMSQDAVVSDLAWLSVFFGVLPAGAVAGLICEIRFKRIRAMQIYASSVIVFLLFFFYVIFPEIDSRNPVVNSINMLQDPTKVVYYKDFNPAYVFALRYPISPMGAVNSYQSSNKFHVITVKDYLPELEAAGFKKVFEGRDLFESNTTVIMEYVLTESH